MDDVSGSAHPAPAELHDPQGLHRRAWDLIPWVLNGSAGEAERRLVETHLAACADCRDEWAQQSRLQAGLAASSVPPRDPGPALQRLWSRIDRLEGEFDDDGPGSSAAAARPRVAAWTRWLVAAVVVQAVGLAALIGVVWERPRSSEYVTLSRAIAAPAEASIRLVPAPGLQLAQLQALLQQSGLQIVESNGDGSILTLAPRPGHGLATAESLTRLRASSGVLLAEPIGVNGAVERP